MRPTTPPAATQIGTAGTVFLPEETTAPNLAKGPVPPNLLAPTTTKASTPNPARIPIASPPLTRNILAEALPSGFPDYTVTNNDDPFADPFDDDTGPTLFNALTTSQIESRSPQEFVALIHGNVPEMSLPAATIDVQGNIVAYDREVLGVTQITTAQDDDIAHLLEFGGDYSKAVFKRDQAVPGYNQNVQRMLCLSWLIKGDANALCAWQQSQVKAGKLPNTNALQPEQAQRLCMIFQTAIQADPNILQFLVLANLITPLGNTNLIPAGKKGRNLVASCFNLLADPVTASRCPTFLTVSEEIKKWILAVNFLEDKLNFGQLYSGEATTKGAAILDRAEPKLVRLMFLNNLLKLIGVFANIEGTGTVKASLFAALDITYKNLEAFERGEIATGAAFSKEVICDVANYIGLDARTDNPAANQLAIAAARMAMHRRIIKPDVGPAIIHALQTIAATVPSPIGKTMSTDVLANAIGSIGFDTEELAAIMYYLPDTLESKLGPLLKDQSDEQKNLVATTFIAKLYLATAESKAPLTAKFGDEVQIKLDAAPRGEAIFEAPDFVDKIMSPSWQMKIVIPPEDGTAKSAYPVWVQSREGQ